jgi:hypothetical protein
MATNALIPIERRAYDAARQRALHDCEIAQGLVLESVLLLPSAARTATTSTVEQDNLGNRGVIVDLVTTAVGSASLTVSIQRWNPASSSWVTMLVSAAVTTNTTTTLTLFPAATAAANVTANASLPRLWRVTVTHADANSATYSLGISTLN